MQDVCRVYKEVGTGQVTIQQPPPAFKPSENLKPLAPVNSKKVEENPPRENVRLLREMRFFVKTKMRIFDFVWYVANWMKFQFGAKLDLNFIVFWCRF